MAYALLTIIWQGLLQGHFWKIIRGGVGVDSDEVDPSETEGSFGR